MVMVYETFDRTPDPKDLDVREQLERIKNDGNRIEHLQSTCYLESVFHESLTRGNIGQL